MAAIELLHTPIKAHLNFFGQRPNIGTKCRSHQPPAQFHGHGCRKRGGHEGHRPAPPVFWTGGGGGGGTGGTKNGTSTCMRAEIILSEVHQLLHITLTIPELRLPLQNEHFLPCMD